MRESDESAHDQSYTIVRHDVDWVAKLALLVVSALTSLAVGILTLWQFMKSL